MRIIIAALSLTGVLVLGFILRFLALGEPLWLDELHTAWCVSGSLAEVATRAGQGNQSPLFFWLEYPLFQALGQNEFALRLLSLLASIATLISIPWLVFRWSGSLAGAWVAMLLAAIDDQFIFFSVEARPYALVQLVTLWQVFFFFSVVFKSTDSDRRHWPASAYRVGWVVTTIALFYLHYTTLLLIGTEAVVIIAWLFVLPAKRERCHRNILIETSLITALLLPGLIQLLSIGQARGDWFTMTDVENYGLTMVAYLAIFLLPICVVALLGRQRSPWESEQPSLVVLLTLVVLPVLFCYFGAVSQQAPLAHFRFSIASVTVLVATVGVGIGRLPRRRGIAVSVVVLVFAIATNPILGRWLDMERWPSQRQEDWLVVVNRINEHPAPVVFCPNLVEDAGVSLLKSKAINEAYYGFALSGIYSLTPDAKPLLSVPIVAARAALSTDQIQELGTQTGFWLLMRTDSQDARRISQALLNDLKSIGVECDLQQGGKNPLHLFWVFKR